MMRKLQRSGEPEQKNDRVVKLDAHASRCFLMKLFSFFNVYSWILWRFFGEKFECGRWMEGICNSTISNAFSLEDGGEVGGGKA